MSERVKFRPLDAWWPASRFDIRVYLVQGEKTALIDTGGPGTELPEALEKVGLTVTDVDQVLLTHGHPDHAGGAGLFKNGADTQIFIHGDDAIFIEDHDACFDRFYAPATTAFLGPEAAAEEKAGFVGFLGADITPDRLLKDGDLVDLGGGVALRVVHLPGHTPGSVGFLFEDDGTFVSGDSIPGAGTPDGCLPVILDIETYRESMERLLTLPIKTLHTTHPFRGIHAEPATVRQGSDVETYLHECLEFAGILWGAMQEQAELGGGGTMMETADRLIDSLPAELGLRRVADLPVPGMAMATIYWNMQKLMDS